MHILSSPSVKSKHNLRRSGPILALASAHQDAATIAPRQLPIGVNDIGQRLDNFLLKTLKGVPKSLLYRLVRQKKITVNRRASTCSQRLASGDVVNVHCALRVSQTKNTSVVPSALKQRLASCILKETRDYIVINKPSGLATHGGSGVNFGVIEIMRSLKPAYHELKLAHRLDRDSSGCLMLTTKRAVITDFNQQPSHKTYLLLVKGVFTPKKQVVSLPLAKNILKSGERMVVVTKDGNVGGKPALTTLELVTQFIDCALIKATLHTGRTHQIRVHATAIGHPLAGDTKYGDKAFNALMKARGLKRLFLHAKLLTFHVKHQLVTVTAPLPEDLAALLHALETCHHT